MASFLKSNILNLFAPSSSPNQLPMYPGVTKYNLNGRKSQTLVCDMHTLIRSQSFFPFFMLVAYEGGSIFRAFLLLLSYPILLVLSNELKLKVMIFITFCGLRLNDMQKVERAVLPKFYLENLNPHVYEVFASVGSRLVLTSVPRVMVDSFLKEYLNVDTVKGTELQILGQFFTGFVSSLGLLENRTTLKELCGENLPDIGIGSFNLEDDLDLISLCKEAYVVGKEDLEKTMPSSKYPKPLIFHDGRLAFLPTPLATLNMFLWLPFGLLLAIFRLSIGALMPFLPCKVVIMLYTLSGMEMDLNVSNLSSISRSSGKGKGVLYVCNHRNNADPAFLILALNNKNRPLTSVVYGVSKIFRLITPLRLVNLSRNDRTKDAEKIRKILSQGDLVMFPEGTTCREPYILRFSSLFAELTDDIVPVAMNLEVGMFYGATASGFFKVLDGLFLAMNPRIYYSVHVLEKLPFQSTVGGGKSIHEVANDIQKKLAHELGFECTTLRRKDKYMILAGSDGVVPSHSGNRS
ncbi:OLC1v1023538C1 [Oldenlandia corymbosa var. corymbosa]|uniref:OLC1v1023538C1 n=1 Tax=Oldenlandia corymbosa var. corymbosa TaxID=529605 RepID=A0AAV1C1W0_OLDCO|nr:OLC1v1023538C1 [Oldenlandia corymbosa var. corymbosa]